MISLTPGASHLLPPLPCHEKAGCDVRFRVRTASYADVRRIKREHDEDLAVANGKDDWDDLVVKARLRVIGELVTGWTRTEPWSVDAFAALATWQEILELTVAASRAQYLSESDEKKSASQ